jgi:hypothetical protein
MCLADGTAGACTKGSCVSAAGVPCGAVGQPMLWRQRLLQRQRRSLQPGQLRRLRRRQAGLLPGNGIDELECRGAGNGCISSPSGNYCGKCGELDQACCDNATCHAGTCATTRPGFPDKCTNACGGPGQACCDSQEGSGCQTGHACVGRVMDVGGTCMPCGKDGQICCGGGGSACQPNLGCGGRVMDAPGDVRRLRRRRPALLRQQRRHGDGLPGRHGLHHQPHRQQVRRLRRPEPALLQRRRGWRGGRRRAAATAPPWAPPAAAGAWATRACAPPAAPPGQICCGGQMCAAGNRCTMGMCQPCGGVGQRCCQTMMGTVPACSAGLTCDPAGNCGTGTRSSTAGTNG